MNRIPEYDKLHDNPDTPTPSDFNWLAYIAYRNSIECGSEGINFDECIHKEQISGAVNILRKNNFETFTISSGYSGLLDVFAEFERCGCELVGMTVVKTPHKDWKTGEYEVKNAALFKI